MKSDTQIHFELYRLLRNEGYTVIPEFKIPKGRLDLVITIEDIPKVAIECKFRTIEVHFAGQRQFNKYQTWCSENKVHLFYCVNKENLLLTVKEINSFLGRVGG